MTSEKITPEELWSQQQIGSGDVDYNAWRKKREMIRQFSQISVSSIFIVDVFKGRYDFASDNFSRIFGYSSADIKNIQKRGDLLEERMHPDDRAQLVAYQIEHGQLIYSLPPEERNDYQHIFQLRMLNAKGQYVNVISRQQVVEKDRNGKAWMVMGMLDISPDQTPSEKVKRIVFNRKTGEVVVAATPAGKRLTKREREVLLLIRQGFLSKEIADKLNLSLYTVSNHRKNILAKLNVDNVMEAVNAARDYGFIY